MIFIGIDPGVHGGIAVISDDLVYVEPMPDTDKELWQLISAYGVEDIRDSVYVTIEKVQGYIGKDKGQSGLGRSMFTFGYHYGIAIMAVVASGITEDHFQKILPKKWQNPFLEGYSKMTYRERKNRLREIAASLFPTIKVTLATADALLIAEYGRRIYG